MKSEESLRKAGRPFAGNLIADQQNHSQRFLGREKHAKLGSMQFDYPHSFDLKEAKERLTLLGNYLQNRHGIRAQWNDAECKIDGKYLMVKIEGTMNVQANQVSFKGKDPGMLWRKKAMNYLKEKLATYLNPNTPVTQLPTGND